MTSPAPDAGAEPTATPLPRLGWRMQAVLDLLVEDPAREVWPYWIDQRTPTRGDGYQVLKRLAEAGWLTSRREDRPTGSGRVLYRLTPSGEELAREAVSRSVRWPAGVPRHRERAEEPTQE
ncbi:PadR family transcriptional regulator [Streptomyces sp. Iso 434]|uniref:PadR family transcriptional regulator n=1 Tax=Streptomyces sp. Iso 434 TaxID=3062272 RepID=UPI00397EEE42